MNKSLLENMYVYKLYLPYNWKVVGKNNQFHKQYDVVKHKINSFMGGGEVILNEQGISW